MGGLTRYNLNCEGSCTVLPRCGVHSLELQADSKQEVNELQTKLPSLMHVLKCVRLCCMRVSGHLQCEGFGLHHSFQNDKALSGDVDITAVLHLVPDIRVHSLKDTGQSISPSGGYRSPDLENASKPKKTVSIG